MAWTMKQLIIVRLLINQSIFQERDSLHVLWQTSQKTIDALETELKTYTNYDNRGIQVSVLKNINFDVPTASAVVRTLVGRRIPI